VIVVGFLVVVDRAAVRVVVNGVLVVDLPGARVVVVLPELVVFRNLVVIVWDNQLYGTTGGQPTATAQGADLAGAAQALGIPEVVTVREPEAFDLSVERALRSPGPWVIVAKVEESGTATKPPLDSPLIKRRFMAAMRVFCAPVKA